MPPKQPPINAEFANWLLEWYLEYQGQPQYQKIGFTYKRAYDSMCNYPDRLESGLDAIRVPFIGKTIAERLEKRLLKESGENRSVPEPVNKQTEMNSPQKSTNQEEGPLKKRARSTKAKIYIPAYRSGPFAILVALETHGKGECLSKQAIIGHAQVLKYLRNSHTQILLFPYRIQDPH